MVALRVKDEVLDLDALVQEDRVSGRVYSDPEMFALEMRRVWGHTWLYVGHESEVAQPGDYKTILLALQPVVLTRHEDGQVYVLFNRCPHRGVMLCREERGNSNFLRCMYHGWTFRNDGSQLGVPFRSAYPPDFDLSALGLAQVPRQASYRGFVFASLSPDVPDLTEWLGPVKIGIDNIADRSPTGEIQVLPATHRYEYPGNWKFQLENMNDIYHAPFSHESTTSPEGYQFRRSVTSERGNLFSQTRNQMEQTRVHALPYGHTYQDDPSGVTRVARSGPIWEAYLAALRQRLGVEQAEKLLSTRLGNVAIYPNLILQEQAQHVRVMVPLGVDRTEVRVQAIHLKGAPEELNASVTKFLNVTHSAASFIQTDDVEAFTRAALGVRAQAPEYMALARGLHREVDGPYPGERIGWGGDETPIRGRYRFWKQLMSQEDS